MTTIAKGNVDQFSVYAESPVLFTPGSGGHIKFGCSSPDGVTRPVDRIIYAAETITIPAGSTVFVEAVTADATYTVGQAAGTIVPVTADTEISVIDHNGCTLRLDASRTLTVPEGLGTAFSCIVEFPASSTLTVDPTGATQIQDTATPAGSTATRTRTHSNNPSGVVLKSTGVANVLSLSGGN